MAPDDEIEAGDSSVNGSATHGKIDIDLASLCKSATRLDTNCTSLPDGQDFFFSLSFLYVVMYTILFQLVQDPVGINYRVRRRLAGFGI